MTLAGLVSAILVSAANFAAAHSGGDHRTTGGRDPDTATHYTLTAVSTQTVNTNKNLIVFNTSHALYFVSMGVQINLDSLAEKLTLGVTKVKRSRR